MAKSEEELAFLRDLYIEGDWTKRFTDLVDKHLTFAHGGDNFLYINAGTGNHCFALREKLGEETAVFGMCESQDMLNIARDKAIAIKSDVDFSTIRFEDEAFDAVLADASLVPPKDLEEFINDAARVAKPGARVSIFFPGGGSYGEIFSLLWEVFFAEGLGENGAATAEMISELPTQTRAEEMAAAAGLDHVESFAASEGFDYDDGPAFLASPLVADLLLPRWLDIVPDEDKPRVTERLATLIDAEDGALSFRFTIKAFLVSGKKKAL